MTFVCPFRSCLERRQHLRSFLRHLKDFHADEGPIPCQFGKCARKLRTFSSFFTYRNHVYSNHPFSTGTVDICIATDDNHSPAANSLPWEELQGGEQSQQTEEQTSDEFQSQEGTRSTQTWGKKEYMETAAALWILKMREVYMIPTSTVVDIVCDVQQLISDLFKHMESKRESDTVVEEHLDIFQNLRTNHMQLRFFNERFGYTEPEEIVLGSRWKSRGVGRRQRKTRVKDSFMYVPIINTITTILKHRPDISSQVMSSHRRYDALLMDFCDGEVARNHSLFSIGGLEVMLSYDELELCNPLGSKRKLHKLGNINPENRSSLRNLFLVAIAKSTLIKRYSLNSILEYIVRDLKKLEDGCDFFLKDSLTATHLYGSLATVSADNPASCAVGGFKESVLAQKCCRQCHISKSDLSHVFAEIPSQLRSLSEHLEMCDELETSQNPSEISIQYGINCRTELAKLDHFNFCDGGLIPDIMHDVLEGILKLEAKLMLEVLIFQSRYFSIHHLNQMIENFELGFMESTDRPTAIDANTFRNTSDHLLAQSASQMWLLGRLLPLMVGNYVPDDDPNWANFLVLLEITDYLFSPVLKNDDCAYLKVIISEHHEEFLKLYPAQSITPKMHFMVHMPRIISRYGPLVRLWTMRFEAKHQYFKRAALHNNNFINVSKSLAIRHQMLQVYHNMSPVSQMETGPVQPTSPEATLGEDISDYKSTKWVRIGTLLIKMPCALLVESTEFPTFIEVQSIFVNSEGVIFYGPLLQTEYYLKHYHCLVVYKTEEYKLLKELNIHHPHPLHIRYSLSLKSFVIVPKHIINCLL